MIKPELSEPHMVQSIDAFHNPNTADTYRNATKTPNTRLEMNGDLADFSLTDVLQILSISKKSGTLFLESDETIACILLEEGKVTHASIRPGESLADRLLRENRISEAVLNELKSVGVQDGGIWNLQTLITESGVMGRKDLYTLARRHLQDIMGYLLSVERGQFGFDLSVRVLLDPFNEVAMPQGIEVGELLLASATARDESEVLIEAGGDTSGDDESEDEQKQVVAGRWADTFEFGNAQGEALAYPANTISGFAVDPDKKPFSLSEAFAEEIQEQLAKEQKSSLVVSLLAEMRACSFEAEVSLLIMRYMSEVAPRSILFMVKNDAVQGLGQFGIESLIADKSADQAVRSIRIPLGVGSLFDQVLESGQPFIGQLPDNPQHEYVFDIIGGNGMELSAFILPIFRNNQAVYLVYGDNFPSLADLSGLDGLVALTTQAGIVLEKMDLENRISNAKLTTSA
jgi:hypothetical protein